MSNMTPKVKKIKTMELTILKRMREMLPIPYASSERVIIKAPTIANGFIYNNFQGRYFYIFEHQVFYFQRF